MPEPVMAAAVNMTMCAISKGIPVKTDRREAWSSSALGSTSKYSSCVRGGKPLYVSPVRVNTTPRAPCLGVEHHEESEDQAVVCEEHPV